MIFFSAADKAAIGKSKTRAYFLGILLIIVGLASIAMPLLASIAVETLAAGLFFGIAFCEAFSAVSAFKSGSTPWHSIIMTVLCVIVGIVFISNPLIGIRTLTIILAIYFILDGITRIIEFISLYKIRGAYWLLISGLFGIVLAFSMWKNIFTGAAVIGTLVGVNLLFGGICFVILGRGCSAALSQLEESQTNSNE